MKLLKIISCLLEQANLGTRNRKKKASRTGTNGSALKWERVVLLNMRAKHLSGSSLFSHPLDEEEGEEKVLEEDDIAGLFDEEVQLFLPTASEHKGTGSQVKRSLVLS